MTQNVPTDRELEVLKVLWQRGEATVREVFEEMNAAGSDLAYTTVLSLLQTMEKKRQVGHKAIGKAYLYFPRIERNQTFRHIVSGFMDKVFDGALEEYVVHALQSRRLSAEELQGLETMIQDARKRSGTRGTASSGKRGRRK